MKPPVIGITPSPGVDEFPHGTFYRYSLSRTYVDAIRTAGGQPIILPVNRQDISATLDLLDGLLLSGGGDFDPALYGDTNLHETTYGIDPDRDSFEIRAFREAVERDLPTFCICRGIQSMNVAMGGTLIQHIPDQVPNALEHRQSNLGKKTDETSHDVRLESDNHPLRQTLNVDNFAVNSFHHQAVGEVASGLEVIATAEDGVIEALWHPGMKYGVGVQWHPEMLEKAFPKHAALFTAFIEAVAVAAVR